MKFLLDEDVHGAIYRGLRRRGLDVARVIEVNLGGQADDVVLAWAAAAERVVVSQDRATMSLAASRRIQQGQGMPGLLLIRRNASIGAVLQDVELIASAANPTELAARILYIPL
ncbi:MAG: DUF5615 family PIN-like protein [Gloeomargarita sp. SKYG98]|nr:DUF5615 family PIN-like protein [Gloeomargarita sp. SKYG98]